MAETTLEDQYQFIDQELLDLTLQVNQQIDAAIDCTAAYISNTETIADYSNPQDKEYIQEQITEFVKDAGRCLESAYQYLSRGVSDIEKPDEDAEEEIIEKYEELKEREKKNEECKAVIRSVLSSIGDIYPETEPPFLVEQVRTIRKKMYECFLN